MKAALALALVVVIGLAAPAHASEVPATFTSDTSGARPKGVAKVPGTVLRVVGWSDANGDNRAVFAAVEKTRTRDDEPEWAKTITVTVYAGRGGKLKQVRQVREVAGFCPFDLTNAFKDASIAVTDLDDDGVGELTFVYATGCHGDVSPIDMKLIMLEGATKYALRGQTRVDLGGGQREGGTYQADFPKAPRAFVEHAAQVWERFVAD